MVSSRSNIREHIMHKYYKYSKVTAQSMIVNAVSKKLSKVSNAIFQNSEDKG